MMDSRVGSRAVISFFVACALTSCSADTPARSGGNGGDGGGGGGSDGGGSGGADGGTGAGGDRDSGAACDSKLRLTIRDFTEVHPDFQKHVESVRGIVKEDLGADKKPVYAPAGSTAVTAGQSEFDQWYRDVSGVNQRVSTEIEFTEKSAGVFVYDNAEFFPIDGQGFGNGPGNVSHNYLFTTEAHTRFTYRGGEVFTFRGDDDLWIFINGKLAIDLGGVHPPEEQTINLDAQATRLGIDIGTTYSMDIFHAERHTVLSNFRIETTIDLSCIDNVTVI